MKFNKSNIDFESKPFSVIEILDNEIGLANMSELKSIIEKELEEGNVFICLDMKNINVINSSGLGVLISCLSKIKSRDGLLKLLNLNAKIFNIFKITKLNLVFDIS